LVIPPPKKTLLFDACEKQLQVLHNVQREGIHYNGHIEVKAKWQNNHYKKTVYFLAVVEFQMDL